MVEKIDSSFFSLSVQPEGFVRVDVGSPMSAPQTLRRLLDFCHCYSPLVIAVDTSEYSLFGVTRYLVAQADDNPNRTDLMWVCNALNRLEPGWRVGDHILRSPDASNLSEQQVRETVLNGRDAATLTALKLPSLPAASPGGWRRLLAAGLTGLLTGAAIAHWLPL